MRFMRKTLLVMPGLWLGLVVASPGQTRGANDRAEPVVIERIRFLIHPFSYRIPRPSGYDGSPEARARWNQYVAYENATSQKWFQAIAGLGPKEALVICAARVGCPPDLRAHAEKHLGSRAVVIEEYLDQRSDFPDQLSIQAKMEIGEDVVAMYQKYGKEWTPQSLSVPIVARGWVERLHLVFNQRGLTFDPKTVRVDGWGESFEGCVANYARFLGPYLGLTKPIENEYEMTVPDAPFLLTARFLEKIPLERDVHLYLWEVADGQLVALFQKARTTVAEPALFAQFPLAGLKIELRDKTGRQVWPANLPHEKGSVAEAIARYNEDRSQKIPDWEKRRRVQDSTSIVVDGELKVPLAVPLDSDVSYIFARGTTIAGLRAVLANAKLVEETSAN